MSNGLINIRSVDMAAINQLAFDLKNKGGIETVLGEKEYTSEGEKTRGVELMPILHVIIGSLAIPAFLKIIELFVSTRKIEVEFEVGKDKVKISGLSEEDIKEKIHLLSTLIKSHRS